MHAGPPLVLSGDPVRPGPAASSATACHGATGPHRPKGPGDQGGGGGPAGRFPDDGPPASRDWRQGTPPAVSVAHLVAGAPASAPTSRHARPGLGVRQPVCRGRPPRGDRGGSRRQPVASARADPPTGEDAGLRAGFAGAIAMSVDQTYEEALIERVRPAFVRVGVEWLPELTRCRPTGMVPPSSWLQEMRLEAWARLPGPGPARSGRRPYRLFRRRRNWRAQRPGRRRRRGRGERPGGPCDPWRSGCTASGRSACR